MPTHSRRPTETGLGDGAANAFAPSSEDARPLHMTVVTQRAGSESLDDKRVLWGSWGQAESRALACRHAELSRGLARRQGEVLVSPRPWSAAEDLGVWG